MPVLGPLITSEAKQRGQRHDMLQSIPTANWQTKVPVENAICKHRLTVRRRAALSLGMVHRQTSFTLDHLI